MTNEVLKKINDVIDTYVRPSLKMDGGDIAIVDFNDNVLSVQLFGSCSCCPHARGTLENLVTEAIHQNVSPDITVRAVEFN